MPIHRPARSTLALLTAAVALPLGAARAASPTTSTTASATPTTTTAAQPTSETTTSSASTQTATSLTTSSSTSTSTTGSPTSSSTTTTATTAQTTSTQWAKTPGGQDLVIGVSRRAHTASDPTDTISDFKFAPATITIHVGDTITWVNNGPAPHTATANDGSFDTGTLNKGQSGSHTFSQAGTFAYICKIHPFMHGTVVVLAAASSAGSGSPAASGSAATTTSTTPTTAPVTSSGGLPNTGMNLLGALCAGLLLAGGGIALRRRLSGS